jgi:hypothetical protein
LPKDSPVRRAYELYNGLKDRQSWDQTAVLFAIRQEKGALWEVKSGGAMEVDPQDGSNRWNPAGTSKHEYLHEKADPGQVARIIEDLMLMQPKSSNLVPGTDSKPLNPERSR